MSPQTTTLRKGKMSGQYKQPRLEALKIIQKHRQQQKESESYAIAKLIGQDALTHEAISKMYAVACKEESWVQIQDPDKAQDQ